jgi:hypothetical protein
VIEISNNLAIFEIDKMPAIFTEGFWPSTPGQTELFLVNIYL